MTKKTLAQRAEEKKKYRIKKTTRDPNAILGVSYAPEAFVGDAWVPAGPSSYNEDEAVEVLRKM